MIKKGKIHCVLLSYELLSTKIYYTSIYIFYLLFIGRISKIRKMMKIQEVHQKIHAKQFLLLYLNCFLLATHLHLKRLNKRD